MQFYNEKNFITKLIADTFILKFHIFIDKSSVYTHRHILSVKLSYNIYKHYTKYNTFLCKGIRRRSDVTSNIIIIILIQKILV